MNNELLNAAKDEAAREFNMDVSMFETPYPEYLNMKVFNQIINRAMEIYAERVNKQALKLLKRAAELVGSPLTNVSSSTDFACYTWQEDYKQFKTAKP